ncbi:MAG: hypothetical protein M1819_001212 [Sarea resinae]|nr:MAG: hypothetical protein M1819_001212 [Sarea resinae]
MRGVGTNPLADETSAEQTPADETSAEIPADETPAEETPAEETPAKETLAEETPAEETTTNTQRGSSADLSAPCNRAQSRFFNKQWYIHKPTTLDWLACDQSGPQTLQNTVCASSRIKDSSNKKSRKRRADTPAEESHPRPSKSQKTRDPTRLEDIEAEEAIISSTPAATSSPAALVRERLYTWRAASSASPPCESAATVNERVRSLLQPRNAPRNALPSAPAEAGNANNASTAEDIAELRSEVTLLRADVMRLSADVLEILNYIRRR